MVFNGFALMGLLSCNSSSEESMRGRVNLKQPAQIPLRFIQDDGVLCNWARGKAAAYCSVRFSVLV